MKTTYLKLGTRIILGLIFVIFGINGFLNFMPTPPPPEAGGKFLMGLASTGYFFPLLKLTEIVSGLLILSGCFTALGLIILAPVSLNIFFYHLFLDPSGLAMPIIIIALQVLLAWFYKENYKPLFKKPVKN